MADYRRRVAVVVLSLAAWPAAHGQTVIAGRVTGNGQPVANAEVSIDSLRARTTDAGRFVLHPARADTVEIFVRAVGFRPATSRVSLAANDTTVADFDLAAVAQTLDSVNVEARAAVITARMQGFEDRRKMGIGHFVTREFLAGNEHSIVSNVLRRSNIRLVQRPSACGGGYAVATSRGGSANTSSPACARTLMPPACYAPVYIDGVPIWGPGWGPPPNVDLFKVIDLEGVEVYRSAIEAPLQFQTFRSPCGVILFWTRTGRK